MAIGLNQDERLFAIIDAALARGADQATQPRPQDASFDLMAETVQPEGDHAEHAAESAQRPAQPRRDPLATARGLKAATIRALLHTTKGNNA